MGDNSSNEEILELKPYMSGPGAWALALGASVGWGSMVVTGTNYLAQAGPLGSVLGLLVATVIMLVIARNYHYLMEFHPSAGGAYTYSTEEFGHDRSFLTAWFLFLVYAAVFWANATSFPLFARYFIGDMFRFGFSYTVLGYELYFGEILLTIVVIAVVGLICISSNNLVQILMIILAVAFCVGIAVCSLVTFTGHDAGSFTFDPLFIPEKKAFLQVVKIVCISPWAFVGFENISHSVEEFRFPKKKTFGVMSIAVICATALYILVILMSVTAYPAEYGSWREYINDCGNLSGIKAMPPFYATEHYFGRTGVVILMIALLGLVLTTMISNMVALSRMLFTMSVEKVLPYQLSKLNKKHIPVNAILFVTAVSFVIPFLGRTAIGWIVDVTTLGATLVYGFVSAAAYKLARKNRDGIERATGIIGFMAMIFFGVFLLLPNLLSAGTMAKESYILFTVWAVLGFIAFSAILRRDKMARFGKSTVVWIVFLSLILFTSLLWMDESSMESANEALENVQEFYDSHYDGDFVGEEEFMAQTRAALHWSDTKNMMVVVGLFAMALGMLISNYTTMNKRTKEIHEQLGKMQDTAYRDQLTGVKSKHAYAEKEYEINERISQETMEEFAIVACDVNGLKYINDTYGHKAGDAYICEACQIVCRIFGHSPVYRIGGDEFVVVTTGHDYENRKELMAHLDRIVEDNIGTERAVISCGLSEYDMDRDKSVRAVFERADALMYERKTRLKEMGARTRE